MSKDIDYRLDRAARVIIQLEQRLQELERKNLVLEKKIQEIENKNYICETRTIKKRFDGMQKEDFRLKTIIQAQKDFDL